MAEIVVSIAASIVAKAAEDLMERTIQQGRETVLSIRAKAAEYLVEPTIQQGRYLFCPNMIIRNLVEAKYQLSKSIEEIQNHIDEDKKATKLIEKSVEEWLTKAKNIRDAAENLKLAMEANKNCFRGWYPPWRRYRMFKQMAKKTKEMREQISKNEIKPLSRLMSLSKIDYDCSDGSFTYFEATKVASMKILEALRDGNIRIIGLCGLGGCGKTTLVKKVRQEAEKSQLFDKIIFVTVSQTPNFKTIQEQMADNLKLKLVEEDEDERAKQLWLSLQEHSRVLVIVDDVWAEFNLKRIGIAFDNYHKGSCKVLLTTRSHTVCASMKCQEIELSRLSDKDAWLLFQKSASIDDNSPRKILNLARKVVLERCRGLPLAIKVMGSSVKGQPREFQANHLKVASKTLKGDVLNCLRFSYDYLQREEAKHLLLMCAMFPESYEINIEDLIRYGVGLGLCGESESFDIARDQIRVSLSELLGSSLLMYTDERKMYVKMHDLIHEMALSISREMGRSIMVNHEKDLQSLAQDQVLKQYFAISSWYNETGRPSCQLNAPKLEILILKTESLSLDLSSVSFECLKSLKVMAIINICIFQSLILPQSIQSLINLKTLCLRRWWLGDISFILSLEGLEVLDLQGCSFNEVPDRIENLHNLKLLDLRSAIIGNYNSKAIGNCSKLEELYVSSSIVRYAPLCFVYDVTPASLLRYDLELGIPSRLKASPDDGSFMRVLYLDKFDVSTLHRYEKNLLQNAEYIHFNSLCGGFKNIVPDINQAVGCMKELSRLWLESCSEIECLFDATSNHAGSFQGDAWLPCWLITLKLDDMENLIEVCRGEPPPDFFRELEELHIVGCQQLLSIFPRQCNLDNLKILNIADSYSGFDLFSMSVARNMRQLEELTIEECPKLRHVITTEVEDGATTIEEISLTPNHSFFPKLKKLRISQCPKLQFIFPISCVEADNKDDEERGVLLELEILELESLPNFTEIGPGIKLKKRPPVYYKVKGCPKYIQEFSVPNTDSHHKDVAGRNRL